MSDAAISFYILSEHSSAVQDTLDLYHDFYSEIRSRITRNEPYIQTWTSRHISLVCLTISKSMSIVKFITSVDFNFRWLGRCFLKRDLRGRSWDSEAGAFFRRAKSYPHTT